MTTTKNIDIKEAPGCYEKKYAWSVWIFLVVGFFLAGLIGVVVVLIFYYLYKKGISFGEDKAVINEERK